jgi:hypothetical protein
LAILPLLVYRCANPVMPQGGPKDAEPPMVVASEPPDFTRHFSSKRISIEFNEFVNLKDINKQFLASPTFSKQPEFKTQGKKLLIVLNDSLRRNTTYSLYLGDAITDITESNPLKDFSYVLSTGSSIDSMELGGIVRNAFDLKPAEGIIAMLYLDENDTLAIDSLPLKVPPYYISKTNKEGRFSIRNLRPEKYLLFALKDANANYFYDQPNEEIAFVDTLVVATPAYIPVPDTTKSDSLNNVSDSLKPAQNLTDKPAMRQVKRDPVAQYELFLFDEADTVQRIANSIVNSDHQIFIQLKRPATNLKIDIVNRDSLAYVPIKKISAGNDSVWMWFPHYNHDTVQLIVSADNMLSDTLDFKLTKEDNQQKGRKSEKVKALNIAGPPSYIDFYKPLKLVFGNPVDSVAVDSFRLIADKDTLMVGFAFADSIRKTATLKFELKPDLKYSLYLPVESFTDIFGFKSDSTVFNFSTRATDAYGSLKLKVELPTVSGQYIIQMMTEKEVVLKQDTLSFSKVLIYNYITPQKLVFKAIHDSNSNGKWDAGEYKRKRQPERVYYNSKPLEIRANWELEEDWTIGPAKK